MDSQKDPQQPDSNQQPNNSQTTTQAQPVPQIESQVAPSQQQPQAHSQSEEWQSVGDNEQQWEESESSNTQQAQNNQIQQEFTLGCEHYLRNCSVQAPCCKIYYTCKLCHDEKYQGPKSKGCKVQRMAFDQVSNIKCLKCNKIQQPSLKCTNPECQITFGKYACLKCKLYENKSAKVNDIFHCNQCKMCRRGKVETTFHCKLCGYCRPISQKGNHKCTENVADSQCPICLQVLKYSVKHYFALPCGHLIHIECSKNYRDINCPVCGMASQKFTSQLNKQIDEQIEKTKVNLPKQLIDKKVNVLCNECLFKSYEQPFHFLGIKCQGCGTYNTKMI